MAQPLHTGGKRGIIPGFWTAGITRSLEVHDPRVLHARNDAQAVTALRNCRRVIDPHGTLLIIEEALPAGDAPGYAKLSDLNMLVGSGGQERTAAEYQALCAASNFALTQTLPTSSRVSIMVGIPH